MGVGRAVTHLAVTELPPMFDRGITQNQLEGIGETHSSRVGASSEMVASREVQCGRLTTSNWTQNRS